MQELVKYYEALVKKGEITPPGYSLVDVSYALCIDWDGTLLSIDTRKVEEVRGKKTVEVPQRMQVPEQAFKGTGITPSYLCDKSVYLLGIAKEIHDEDPKIRDKWIKRCHDSFQATRALHHKLLDGTDHPAARALLAFFDRWDVFLAETHPGFTPEILTDFYAGKMAVFLLPNGEYAHENDALLRAWDHREKEDEEQAIAQCLVTGLEDQPIPLTHKWIKGLAGGQAMGSPLVSFNKGKTAFESYGRSNDQCLNAPVGEFAAFAYTTALNHLLASKENRQFMGNTSMVYWAEDGNEEAVELVNLMLEPGESDSHLLHNVMEKVSRGLPIDGKAVKMDTPFCVLGLSPNAGRVSVRFFWKDRLGNIVTNLIHHYQRMEIDKPSYENREFLSKYWLLQETVSPKVKNPKPSDLLSGAVMRSMITGVNYPEALAQAILTRIRAEREVSWGKAAIIKAWLIKNRAQYDYTKEVATVSLNKTSNNKAYLLGRLFSVLEKAQEDANPGIKATIKDKYFPSACAAPGTVFPLLLKLSNFHISKSDYGYASSRQIGEILDRLNVDENPFPARLSLEEQGIFILGYYQQNQARYTKKGIDEKTEEVTNNG